MARFSIISKDGNKIRYEGKPRYIGTYLKPSYLEFSEIASPTPIDWQIGDYIDYPRTGMRYRLYSIPQASKNARKGSHGRAFTYSNVQLHAATKELEIALFKDLVSADNNIHFSTSPDVATFEDVYGIARRIQACMDDLYPNRWVIEVADFNTAEDAEMLENITTAKDFALSGGTCLDALTKIYELWQEVGWIHTYDSASGKDVITIGYANKRIGANTTEAYIYGKGNGLTAIKKTQANKDEFATRLYVYGSDRNLPSRYYNGKYILNADSVDIRNLMIPIGQWKTTGGVPDARKAYIENAEAVAKYGIIPKTHYFDSDDAGVDIYPTIEGITIGQVRRLQADYKPSTSIYPNDGERIDEVKSSVNPSDDGVIRPLGKAYKYYRIENIESQSEDITLEESTTFKDTKILLLTDLDGEGKVDMTVIPDIKVTLEDAGFTEVNVTFELTDSPTKMKTVSKLSSVVAKKNEVTGEWEFKAPRMSVDYDFASNGSIPVCYVMTIDATLEKAKKGEIITLSISEGEIEIGANALLDKEFTITLKQIGFNIEERASIGSGKTISMKSGDNEGRNFIIKECRYNASSDSWVLTCKRQQDNNLGMLFPNKDYQIRENDRFVLLDIAMPELYLSAAMERLFVEGQKLLSKVSRIQNNYEPSIDAVVMAESGRTIREGMFMQIADEDIMDGTTEYILIDTINIYEDEAAIPTYKVTLKEKKKVSYKGTPSATTTSNTNPVEEKTDVDLSGYVTKEQFAAVEMLKDLFYKHDNETYGTKYNLFSEKEISANGLNLGGGTSGGGGSTTLDGLIDVNLSSPQNGNILVFNGTHWVNKPQSELVPEVDLSDYYTKQQTQNAITTALSPYIKATDADGKYAALASFNALQSSFDSLYSALNDDTSGVINTWNEVVDFVNEYSGSEDLSTILGKMNTDINARVKVSDFDTWKTDVFNPLSVTVTNLGKKVDTNTANINKLLGWFNVDADGNLFTTLNFYSTKEISANGISQGTGGGGSGLISSVLGVGSLGATLTNDNSVVFNAYATNEIYKATQGHASRIGVLESQVGQLTTQRTKVSVSDLLTTGTKIATITVDGVAHEVKGDFLPTSGGEIKGDARVIGYLTTDKNRIRLGSHYMLVSNDEWMVTDANWQNQYSLLHSGNVGGYAALNVGLAAAKDTKANALGYTYATEAHGGKYAGGFITFGSGLDGCQLNGKYDGKALAFRGMDSGSWSDWKTIAFTSDLENYLPLSGGTMTGRLTIQGEGTAWMSFRSSTQSFGNIGMNETGPRYWDSSTSHSIIHSGNIGDYNAGSADKLTAGAIADANAGQYTDKALRWFSGIAKEAANFPSFSAYQNGLLALPLHISGTTAQIYITAGNGFYFRGNTNADWKTIAFTDSTVEAANKLATPRTIWGRSFDGTKDIKGTMLLPNSVGIYAYVSDNSKDIHLASLGSDDVMRFGYASSVTHVRGNAVHLLYDSHKTGFILNSHGNVTIGASNFATGVWKLYIHGKTFVYGQSTRPSLGAMPERCFTVGYSSNEYVHYGLNTWIESSGNAFMQVGRTDGTATAYNLVLNPLGGNVLIGTTTDSGYKLDVAGTLHASGAVTFDSALAVGSIASVSALKVGSSAQGNILMQRPSYNYIWAEQAGGTLVFGVQDVGATGTQNASLWIHSNFVTPGTRDNTVALGSEFYRWSIVHAFVGRFHGNLSVASTSTFTGKTTHNGGIGTTTIETSGAATIGGNLTINGATTHNGIAYFGGTTYYINTSGNANFNAISGRSLQVDSAAFNGTIHSNEYSGSVAKWSITADGAASFASFFTSSIETGSFLATGDAQIYGSLRLRNGSANYGNALYFGDGSLCYLHEEVDDRLTIYAQKGLVTKAATGTAWDSITKENWIDDNSAHTRFVNNYNALAIIIDKDYGASYRRAAIQVGDTSNNVGTLYLNPKGGEVHVGSTLYVSTINAGSTLYLQASTITNKAGWWTLSATGDFYTLGNIAAEGEISANALNQGSDIRFKHQLGDITLDLNKIANAPMFRFTWTNRENSRVQIGTSAQYWKDSARELVSVDKDDFHRLDYATLGVLIGVTLGKTVKNHEDRIKELETKVESLEAENRRLRYGN